MAVGLFTGVIPPSNANESACGGRCAGNGLAARCQAPVQMSASLRDSWMVRDSAVPSPRAGTAVSGAVTAHSSLSLACTLRKGEQLSLLREQSGLRVLHWFTSIVAKSRSHGRLLPACVESLLRSTWSIHGARRGSRLESGDVIHLDRHMTARL